MTRSNRQRQGPDPHNQAQSFEAGVLPRELELLKLRRRRVFPRWPGPSTTEGTPVAPGTALDPAAASREGTLDTSAVYADAHKCRPLGVAFSGGGIRSATFNLGVLQGLAESGLLPYVDYLSTVSGGGYIGAWLHGVIARHGGDPRAAARRLSPTESPTPGPPKSDPITFLRKYSNYLAPRPGLFSLDSWVIGTIWLRNFLLNQLILLPAICAVVMLTVLTVFAEQMSKQLLSPFVYSLFGILSVGGAILAFALALVIVNANLTGVVEQTFQGSDANVEGTRGAEARVQRRRAERFSLFVVPSVFFGAIVLGCTNVSGPWYVSVLPTIVGTLGMFGIFQVQGGYVECYTTRHPDDRLWARWHVLWMSTVSMAVTVGLDYATWQANWTSWGRVAFTPPLMCLHLLAGGTLLTGLMGADYPDAAREWLARLATRLLLTCAAWSSLFVLAVYGPWGFMWLLGRYNATAVTATLGWLATTAAGVLAGGRTHPEGVEKSPRSSPLTWIKSAAPTVFMVGYLLFIATGVHAALRGVAPLATPAIVIAPDGGWLAKTLAPARGFSDDYAGMLTYTSMARPSWLFGFLVVMIVVAAVASRFVNINEFSMHHFYKNRLVRCYLGASNNRRRRPNYLTGFDPRDDFPISLLVPKTDPGSRALDYLGPYPIVNATLNLNAGSELSQQERKAGSFIFTPEFCGFVPSQTEEDDYFRQNEPDFEQEGYRRTKNYGYPAGPDLGTAIAISGAAASPNAGSQTSGPMAFLLTVFDARLGWWLGNPRRPEASKLPGPLFALKYLFAELFGLTTGRSRFVNLSDGGHFENLGLYELVRRRCRYIIIGDAEQDGRLTFESLGGAIRKCRADFGVEIDLNPEPIRIKANGFSETHCVVGSITYPEVDQGRRAPLCSFPSTVATDRARGWILYMKASLTGDEPADVIEYRSRNADFPHQSTGDQFFSESQFESYRRLGLHVVRETFQDVPLNLDTGAEDELLTAFQSLAEKWYPRLAASDEAAMRLVEVFTELMRRLSSSPELETLVPELVAGVPPPPTPGFLNPQARIYLLEVIQLMQDVHTGFRLDDATNRANPRNAGWMKVFLRWSQSPALREVWASVQDDYNPIFRQFINEHLDRHTDVPMRT